MLGNAYTTKEDKIDVLYSSFLLSFELDDKIILSLIERIT